MDWTRLEEQFRAATRQIPLPEGIDAQAFEWDHSRLGRALGISGKPRLGDLRYAGPLLFCARRTVWEEAAGRYAAWSREAGWSFLRLTAQGSIGAPDPIVTGLGEAVSGEEGMIFGGVAGVPRAAVGRRPRAAGCSIPLASGERWAIAADRVRRRVRLELALRPMTLFVEAAHLLTPAALTALGFLSNAHRAWQGRMLSRPAPFLAVLALPPEAHAAWPAMLKRFGVRRDYEGVDAYGIEESPAENAKLRSALDRMDIEEEHLLCALADAPYALDEEAIASIFGASGPRAVDRLEARGLVRRRREVRRTVVLPHPALARPAKPPRQDDAELPPTVPIGRRAGPPSPASARPAQEVGTAPEFARVREGEAEPAAEAAVAPDAAAGVSAGVPAGVPASAPAGAPAGVSAGVSAGDGPRLPASPPPLPALPEPPTRVRRAILDVYRDGVRRGRNHLVYGIAALHFRMGQPTKARAWLARAEPGDTAFLPAALREEFDQRADPLDPRARCRDLAVRFATSAHARDYPAAAAAATSMHARPLRSEREFADALLHILSVGRGHLDRCLPDAFWAGFDPGRVDVSLVEATCILASLFARLRSMTVEELRDRCDATRTLIATERSPTNQRLHHRARIHLSRVCELLAHRARLALSSSTDTGAVLNSPDTVLLQLPIPFWLPPGMAYVGGTITYAGILDAYQCRSPMIAASTLGTALWLIRSTLHPEDQVIQLSAMLRRLRAAGLTMLMRSLGDELALVSHDSVTPIVRLSARRSLQMLASPRNALRSVERLLLREADTRSNAAGWEAAQVALMLLRAGEFEGAWDCARYALRSAPPDSLVVANVIRVLIVLARATLRWNELPHMRTLVSQHRHVLRRCHAEYLEGLIDGAWCMSRGDPQGAYEMYRKAEAILPRMLPGGDGGLRAGAVRDRLMAVVLRDLHAATPNGTSAQWLERYALAQLRRIARSECCTTDVTGNLRERLDTVLIALELLSKITDTQWQTWIGHVTIGISASIGAGLSGGGSGIVELAKAQLPGVLDAVRTAIAQEYSGVLSVASDAPALESMARALVGSGDTPAMRAWRLLWRSSGNDKHSMEIVARQSLSRSARRVRCDSRGDGAMFSAVYADARSDRGDLRQLTAYEVDQCGGVSRETVVVTEIQGAASRRTTAEISDSVGREIGAFRCGQAEASRRSRSASRCTVGIERQIESMIIGSSEASHALRRAVIASARSELPVLITGESGVGKYTIAKCIHELSRRRERVAVTVECAALADSMIEAELFGNVRGAFSGAVDDRSGLLAAAHESSLLLSRLEELSPRAQVVLLRAIETGEYRPVGASVTAQTNARVIATAHPCLFARLREGRFRSDLFYRINVMRLAVPPLRERGNDAVDIARHWLSERGVALSRDAEAWINEREWRGNLRELRHATALWATDAPFGVVDRSVILRAGFDSDDTEGEDRACGVVLRSARVAARRAQLNLAGPSPFGVRDFARAASVSRRTAQRYLAALVSDGKLIRTGAGRGVRYSFAQHPEAQAMSGQ